MRQRNEMEVWTRRTLAFVAGSDAEWVGAEAIIEAAAPTVPPGRALREYQMTRSAYERKRQAKIDAGAKAGPMRPAWPQDEQIRMGRRSLINAALNGLIAGGWLERRGDSDGREYRISGGRMHAEFCCAHGGSCRARPGEDAKSVLAAEMGSDHAEPDPEGADGLAWKYPAFGGPAS